MLTALFIVDILRAVRHMVAEKASDFETSTPQHQPLTHLQHLNSPVPLANLSTYLCTTQHPIISPSRSDVAPHGVTLEDVQPQLPFT